MQNKVTHIRYNVINESTKKSHFEILRSDKQPIRNGFQFIAIQEVTKHRQTKNKWEDFNNENYNQ